MSLRADGGFSCDLCGADVGNGGVRMAVVVSDLDPDNPGHVRNLHFCRDRQEDGEDVRGCEHKLLSPSRLKHYNETKESDAQEAPARPSTTAAGGDPDAEP